MKSLPLLSLGLLVLTSCNKAPRTGPPDLRYGRDECAECGMSIVEEHSACALLVLEHDRREYKLFDDLGCLLDHEREHHPQTVERHTHDYATKRWISADSARYLMSESVRTPMGSWIAAYADDAAAEAAREKLGGKVFDLDALRTERVAWREKRFGKPKPAQTPATPEPTETQVPAPTKPPG